MGPKDLHAAFERYRDGTNKAKISISVVSPLDVGSSINISLTVLRAKH
jgi:hypothetical protein